MLIRSQCCSRKLDRVETVLPFHVQNATFSGNDHIIAYAIPINSMVVYEISAKRVISKVFMPMESQVITDR